MSAVRTGLYARLTADATLKGLLSSTDAIYHREAPRTRANGSAVVPPYVILHKQAGTPLYAVDGSEALKTEIWLVKGVCRGGASTPADAIDARLAVVLHKATLTIAGREGLACLRTSDVDYPEDADGETWHHVGGLYRISHEET
jgi:hypothetical protein